MERDVYSIGTVQTPISIVREVLTVTLFLWNHVQSLFWVVIRVYTRSHTKVRTKRLDYVLIGVDEVQS